MSAKYEIFLGTDRQYYFRLKAPNGEKILSSEGYTTKANCQNGVQSVRINSPHDANYKKLTSVNGQYYFTLHAGNGQVIGKGETYTTAQARDGGIAAVKAYGPGAPTTDLT
ncbi:YegP family protein [Stutzerimonas degradans]|uniref:YegP family protein n=1 Tax=Stutzerimonas degradans TaxID=2968968 RepID=UPI0028D17A5F|nr:YegP family protein [Stutzerimonas degradans]